MSKIGWVDAIKAFGCCACVVLSACSTLSQMELDATEEDATHYVRNGNLSAEVEALAQPLVEHGETTGIVVGVLLPDGSTQFFGYGVTKKEGGTTPDENTIFATGSLSKGFLGAVTALLVREGVLSWDDTLGKLLPPTTPLSVDAKKITLLQLATHTSGLPNQPLTFQTFRYFVEYQFTGNNFYRHFNRDYVFNYLADFKAPTEADVHYSSLGYALLSYALEQRTGLSVDVLVERKILQPLGLKNTGYIPEALPGNVSRAQGHVGDEPKFIARGTPVPDWQFTELMRGSAALYSNAKDLLTFAAVHLSRNQTTFSAALTDTLQVRVPKPKDAPAIAWFVDDVDGQHITYQVGMVAGFAGYVGLDVERRTAVVVLQNSFNWTDKVGHKLLVRLGRALPKVAIIN